MTCVIMLPFQNGKVKIKNKIKNMRTKNPDNVYSFTCPVTGKVTKTNPKQFNATAARLNLTDAVLKSSLISREGRRIIKDAKMTAEQVVATYGVDPAYAATLKHLVKPAAPIEVAVPAESIATETVAEAAPAETAETPAPEAVATETAEAVAA